MILNGLFKIIISFVIATLNIILSPIYLLISSILGFEFVDLVDSINSLFNSFINFVPFAVDASFISPFVISLLVHYLVFKYTAKLGVNAVKLTIKWYNKLKG